MTWDFIGNGWAVDLLRRQMSLMAVRQAYLFAGPPGVGKRTLALRFAQALFCELRSEPGQICALGDKACRACRLISNQSYPDLHVVQVEAGRSAVRVDQIRELQRLLALAPFEARKRFALLPDFQDATHGAANALLKTLEEPPPSSMLLLTAPRVESLLPTIVSRCEVLNLRALPVADLAEALQQRGHGKDRAELLAGLSGGRPGRAFALAHDPTALEQREKWLTDLRNMLVQDRRSRFAYVHQTLGGKNLDLQRRETVLAVETWLSLWRDALFLATEAHGRVGNPDRSSDLRWLAQMLSAQHLASALLHTQRTLEALGKYVNPRLALEALMLDLPRIQGPPAGGAN